MNWQYEFESLVSSIGDVTYGKERWFYQGDDVWYDQDDGEYCSTYILCQKILDAIRDIRRNRMTEKELAKKMGYEGCRNCEHQIAPLRSCKWAERGGDGVVHIICPMWDKRRRTNENNISD